MEAGVKGPRRNFLMMNWQTQREESPAWAPQDRLFRGGQSADLHDAQTEDRTASFPESRHLRALNVDFPVEFHQHLDGDNLRMIG